VKGLAGNLSTFTRRWTSWAHYKSSARLCANYPVHGSLVGVISNGGTDGTNDVPNDIVRKFTCAATREAAVGAERPRRWDHGRVLSLDGGDAFWGGPRPCSALATATWCIDEKCYSRRDQLEVMAPVVI
jgi:hypothetical protein